jgi:hypothetical protein
MKTVQCSKFKVGRIKIENSKNGKCVYTIATSVARRGGSGSFAAGGGDVSPGNSRLGQGQTRPEAEAVVMMNVGHEHVGRRTLTGPEVFTSYVLRKKETNKCIYYLLKT